MDNINLIFLKMVNKDLEFFKSLTDKKVIDRLSHGAVGALPTDTLYGIVCRAKSKAAVARLYDLKKPRDGKPGTIIAANIEQLVELGVKRRYLKAIEHLWPNKLSIILPLPPELDYLLLGLAGMPFRVVESGKLKDLLEKVGPLLTSSANRSGQSPAQNIKEIINYFGGKLDFYVDGGEIKNTSPSTIIRIVDDAIDIVRPGIVEIDEYGQIKPKTRII